MPKAFHGMTVLNEDIETIVVKVQKMRFEAAYCTSNSQSEMSPADLQRQLSFHVDLRAYVSQIMSEPLIDTPKASPTEYKLPVPEDLPTPDNDALRAMIKRYDRLEEEVSKCNSNARSNGLNVFDHVRLINQLDKMDAFLKNYVAKILPIDWSEGMPLYKVTGEGRDSSTGNTIPVGTDNSRG